MSRPYLLLTTCLLGACTVGPDYRLAPVSVPPTFTEAPGWQPARPQDEAPRGDWWTAFGDPTLNRLEPLVALHNQTLAAAEAAYRNAQALVTEAASGLYPTLGATAGVTRAATGSTGHTSYSLQGSASWEIDLWGRIRRQVESSRAQAQASAADIANTRLSAEALLATDLVSLEAADDLRGLLDRTAANDAQSLRIARNQYAAGFVARSDVITAQATLEATQSAAVNVGVSRAAYAHAVAVLTGQPPESLNLPPATLPAAIPAIPGALPATLLQRRPDIASAERQMAAQNAQIGVAVAAYYPAITLSAAAGFVGDPLSSLISAANRVWSLGAAASETLFAGGARSAAVQAARATYDQSVATYRQTVLTALQQVEDQLAALRILAQQSEIQDRAVADSRRAAEIALNEYRAGTTAYTAVVIAQNAELTDEQTALSLRLSRFIATIALIEALGGGWNGTAPDPGPASVF